MTDEGHRSEPAGDPGRGTAVEGVATPDEGDRTASDDEGDRTARDDEEGGRATDDADGSDGRSATWRTVGWVRTGTADRDSRASRNGDQPISVRALRLAISLVAVLGYVLVFGAAVGAVAHLLTRAFAAAGIEQVTAVRVLGGSAMLMPVAAFLYIALYDVADLTRPGWLDGHPPLVDAWLLVVGASGVVTVALSRPDGPNAHWELGWVASGLAAYVALPLWLARRCLGRPNWVLGGLTLLLTPALVAGALVATFALPLDRPAVAAAVALVGTAVPYALAAASPGPDRLAVRAAERLRQAWESLQDTIRGA